MPIPNKAEVSTYFYDAGVLRALTVTRDGRVVSKVPTVAERRKVNLRYYLDQGFIQHPRDLVNFCPNRKNLVDCRVVYFTTEDYVLTDKYWSAGVQYATTEVTILKYGGVEPLIKVVPAAPLRHMLFNLQNFRDRMQENPTTIPANHYFIVVARGKGVLEFAGVRNQLPQSSQPPPIPECPARRAKVASPTQSAPPHPAFAAGGADVRVPPPSYSPVSPPSPIHVAPIQVSVHAAPPAPVPQRQVSVDPGAGPSGSSGSGQFAAVPSRTLCAPCSGPATASVTSPIMEQRLANLERNFAEMNEMLSRIVHSECLVFGASARSDKVYRDKYGEAFTPRSKDYYENEYE